MSRGTDNVYFLNIVYILEDSKCLLGNAALLVIAPCCLRVRDDCDVLFLSLTRHGREGYRRFYRGVKVYIVHRGRCYFRLAVSQADCVSLPVLFFFATSVYVTSSWPFVGLA